MRTLKLLAEKYNGDLTGLIKAAPPAKDQVLLRPLSQTAGSPSNNRKSGNFKRWSIGKQFKSVQAVKRKESGSESFSSPGSNLSDASSEGLEETDFITPEVHAASVTSLESDISTKEEFKYSPELEQGAKNWICDLLEDQTLFQTESLANRLKSGEILCKCINKIQPDTIPKINTTKFNYAHMENIGNYIKACISLGLPKTDLFDTPDLYDKKNMNVVINNIHLLAHHVAKSKDYCGPKIANSSNVRTLYSSALSTKQFSSILNDQSDRVISKQEQEFIDWMNSKLLKADPPLSIESLTCTAMKNGIALIKLVKILTNVDNVGFHEENPQILWHCMQNISLVLRFLYQQTFIEINCKAQEIILGNIDSIINLLQFLRGKFDIDYLFLQILNEGHSDEQKLSLQDMEKIAIENETLAKEDQPELQKITQELVQIQKELEKQSKNTIKGTHKRRAARQRPRLDSFIDDLQINKQSERMRRSSVASNLSSSRSSADMLSRFSNELSAAKRKNQEKKMRLAPAGTLSPKDTDSSTDSLFSPKESPVTTPVSSPDISRNTSVDSPPPQQNSQWQFTARSGTRRFTILSGRQRKSSLSQVTRNAVLTVSPGMDVSDSVEPAAIDRKLEITALVEPIQIPAAEDDAKSPRQRSPRHRSKSPRHKSPRAASKSPRQKSPRSISKSPRQKSPRSISKSPRPKSKSPRPKSPSPVREPTPEIVVSPEILQKSPKTQESKAEPNKSESESSKSESKSRSRSRSRSGSESSRSRSRSESSSRSRSSSGSRSRSSSRSGSSSRSYSGSSSYSSSRSGSNSSRSSYSGSDSSSDSRSSNDDSEKPEVQVPESVKEAERKAKERIEQLQKERLEAEQRAADIKRKRSETVSKPNLAKPAETQSAENDSYYFLFFFFPLFYFKGSLRLRVNNMRKKWVFVLSSPLK